MSAEDFDSWQETIYLLRSPANARRLMEAVARDKSGRPAVTKTMEELGPWRASSEKHPLRPRCLGGFPVLARRRPEDGQEDHRLIAEIQRDPFAGIGKPEPLKGDLSGYWSRRIDDEHRLVYRADDKEVKILKARYHYRSD